MRQALISSQYGKEIAKATGISDNVLFLSGMIHGIHKPITLQMAADFHNKSGRPLDSDLIFTLTNEFQQDISDMVIKSWDLPDFLNTALKYYCKYDEAPKFQLETKATYLSDILAMFTIYPELVTEEMILNDDIADDLDLTEDQLKELIEKKEDILELVQKMAF
jgi:HD-like signal output (HDOD) protein